MRARPIRQLEKKKSIGEMAAPFGGSDNSVRDALVLCRQPQGSDGNVEDFCSET